MVRRGARWSRMSAGLVGALAAALLATGCSGARTPEHLPPTDDPVVWAGRLCSSLTPLAGLRDARPAFDPNDPAKSRDSLTAFFTDTRGRIEEALKGLDEVGPAPAALRGGGEVTTKVRTDLQRLREAFAEAQAKLDGVDPTDPVELGTILPEVLQKLADASVARNPTDLGDDPALKDAIRQAPSCGLLVGSGTGGSGPGASAPGTGAPVPGAGEAPAPGAGEAPGAGGVPVPGPGQAPVPGAGGAPGPDQAPVPTNGQVPPSGPSH